MLVFQNQDSDFPMLEVANELLGAANKGPLPEEAPGRPSRLPRGPFQDKSPQPAPFIDGGDDTGSVSEQNRITRIILIV
jgi:hypothetical protein